MESEVTPQFKPIKPHLPGQPLLLPEEIMEEILSRLPVKSLLKFKSVSKPWRSLIDSEYFIKKHLDTSTKNPNFAHHKIILESIGRLKQCSLPSLLSDPSSNQFHELGNINLLSLCIVGCCNGLVCLLLNFKFFILWNPSTRNAKRLPVFDRDHEHCHIRRHGFGFDDSSGDYVVFGVILSFGRGRMEGVCKSYSLQTNSWKKVETFTPLYYEGRFASGKIHWSEISNGDIVYFDLGSEMFNAIPSPAGKSGFYRSMGVVGGRLSLLSDDDGSGKLDIWVLKEYGVNACWEKAVTIPYLQSVRTPKWDTTYLSLLGVGPNGEILLPSRSSLEIFYPVGNGFWHCQVKNYGGFQADIYVESLVQCNPDSSIRTSPETKLTRPQYFPLNRHVMMIRSTLGDSFSRACFLLVRKISSCLFFLLRSQPGCFEY